MKHRNLTLSQVRALAKKLYKSSKGSHQIYGLSGTLGSGKTTFTKALAEAMGIKKAKSPTFTVVHCYKAGKKSLYHIDLYRLDKTSELETIGLGEILTDANSVTVIEWVDKFPKLLKKCTTLIKFEVKEKNLRNVTVTHN